MYWKRKNKQARGKLSAALEDADYSHITSLAKQLGLKPKSRKKVDAIAEILPLFEDTAKLKKIWNQLNNMQQKAVAEAVFHKDGEFDNGRFRTKYGQIANFGENKDYDFTPSLLKLFIFSDEVSGFIPDDLAKKLKSFVEKPKGFAVKTVETLPEKVTITIPSYRETKIKHIPLTTVETANNSLQDLYAVLRLLNEKKIAVSSKTSKPSKASVTAVSEVLLNGDFYELKEDKNIYPQIGAIKSLGWIMLLQASKLTQISAGKLVVSANGRRILAKSAHEIIKNIWETWQKNTLLDEFNRVEEIKGQRYKNRSNLTGIKPRREAVVNSLEICPVGEWIGVEEFLRCVRLNFDFEIVRDEWNLYISSKDYGSLGYEYGKDLDKWQVLQARYILAVLFEYAATLGLLDVAYISPIEAKCDFTELWGTDDLDFLSRYDGLKFIKINELGAFCLGLTDAYEPPEIEVETSFTILPNLEIKITGKPLTIDEEMFLENFAEKESEKVWRISQSQTIKSLEHGQDIEALREFLQKRDEQMLPETVEGFLRNIPQRADALKYKGAAQIFECRTAKIADEIAKHPKMKKFCQRTGQKSVVVFTEQEQNFRELLGKIGYGVKFE